MATPMSASDSVVNTNGPGCSVLPDGKVKANDCPCAAASIENWMIRLEASDTMIRSNAPP